MSEPARGPHDPPPVPTLAQQELTGAWAGTSTPALNLGATVTASGAGLSPDAFGLPDQFGRYAVKEVLGRGGMGSVFLAHDPQLDRLVALKIPTFQGAPTATQKERFLREARAISRLRHPHICPVFDVGEEQGLLFLTMAYIEGTTLSAVLERGPMAPEQAVALVRKVASAMQAAHAHGTIHRDLKPANIMIDPAGEPVVMDFGLARRSDAGDDTAADRPAPAGPDAGLTQLGSVLGTPAYMPPEQARGDVAAVGPRSDVYSLGVILFELLTGRRPFVGADTADTIRLIQEAPPPRLRDFYPWMDAGLEAACQKAMAKVPGDRFWSMAQFEAALKEVVDPELTLAEPPVLLTPPKKPPPLPNDLPRPERAPEKKKGWITLWGCLGVSVAFLVVCVGGPTLAVWLLVTRVMDKVKEVSQASATASAEWEDVKGLWRPPPADAPADVVFPPTLPGGYTRIRQDVPAPDPDLGLNLPGRRAVYTIPDGGEVSVAAYACTDAQAAAVEGSVKAFVQRLQQGGGPGANPNRKKFVYSSSNSTDRTITYGFSDALGQNNEYGKTWYSQGWLFHFQTTAPMVIEYFPPKYLLEVARKANAPPPKPKARAKDKPKDKPQDKPQD